MCIRNNMYMISLKPLSGRTLFRSHIHSRNTIASTLQNSSIFQSLSSRRFNLEQEQERCWHSLTRRMEEKVILKIIPGVSCVFSNLSDDLTFLPHLLHPPFSRHLYAHSRRNLLSSYHRLIGLPGALNSFPPFHT